MSKLLTTPKDLKQRALKIWQRGDLHRAWLQRSSRFPLETPLKSISAKTLLTDYSAIQELIYSLRQDSQKQGYLISDKAISHRQLGEQKLPALICFKTEAIFLNYIAKVSEFIQFKTLTQQSLAQDALLLDLLLF